MTRKMRDAVKAMSDGRSLEIGSEVHVLTARALRRAGLAETISYNEWGPDASYGITWFACDICHERRAPKDMKKIGPLSACRIECAPEAERRLSIAA